ncbi:hypothetical protein ES288_D04G119500v1 [Gossypium darwinii]|uniref:Uncharacterized protein n=1 Tax=Gossypium darwinii TaxID=34276 RepID=A0A5D2CZD7_GOSDA|nr:hypothetical protein ES288_D04G119500v1 [Gossypium darwinii]
MTPVRRSRKRKRRSLTPFSPTPTTTKGSPSTEPRGGFRCQRRGDGVRGDEATCMERGGGQRRPKVSPLLLQQIVCGLGYVIWAGKIGFIFFM